MSSASSIEYVELHAHSCYSLLDGAVTPVELVQRAAALEMPALALTDPTRSMARAFSKAQGAGLTVFGAERRSRWAHLRGSTDALAVQNCSAHPLRAPCTKGAGDVAVDLRKQHAARAMLYRLQEGRDCLALQWDVQPNAKNPDRL